MPDDKEEKIEVLNDITTDLNIETITLDDIELNDMESRENIPGESSIPDEFSAPIDDISFEPVKVDENQRDGMKIPDLDSLQSFPEPEMPVEAPENLDTLPERKVMPEESADLLNRAHSSEDDIITIEGAELDKLIYGDLQEDRQKRTDEMADLESSSFNTPEISTSDYIDEIPVIEEPEIEEEKTAATEVQKEEDLIPAAGIATGEKPLTQHEPSKSDFDFDLSAIPDISQVEEDEPIALSLEELNKIDISEGSIAEYETLEAPEVPEVKEFPSAFTGEEGENVEISLEEINKIEENLPGAVKLSPDAYIFESPETKDLKGEVIEQKIDTLSESSKDDLRKVLRYLDNLLEDLPEDKIKEFAKSEYYDLYVTILNKLGI
jgi:hypothetical protein